MNIVDWKLFCTALVLLALVGCSDRNAQQRDHSATLETRATALASELQTFNTAQRGPAASLVIQLAFGREADLDLYVTDPLLETVYFANKKGRSGGKISADRRCDSPPLATTEIQVEEVIFETPLSGRYRIGVDYPNRCDSGGVTGFEERAAFAVSVQHNGVQQNLKGSVGYRFFEVAVFDFDIDANE